MPPLSQQLSCMPPEQKLDPAGMVSVALLSPSHLCRTPDVGARLQCRGTMLHGWVHGQAGRHGGCAPPPLQGPPANTQPTARQAPAGLPTALNIYRMEEPLLRKSTDPSPCLLLARRCTRNAASPPLLSAPTDLLTSAAGLWTRKMLSNRALVQENA